MVIYLDHNATTPIAPEVVDAIRPYLERRFGNPSSAHAYGAEAADAVAHARVEVAGLLGAEPDTVVFTGSGSEADTLAIVAATGSACHSGRTEPSSVLTAMGLDEQRALGAVRLSLGYDTTAAEIGAAAAALAAALVPA